MPQNETGPVDRGLRDEVATMGRAVDEGQLWIDGVLVAEGAHERCAQRYTELADQVDQQIEWMSAATSLPGFGGFESGDALRRGFEQKALDALVRLREYSAAARDLAATFRAAAAAYAEQEADIAIDLARVRSDVGVSGA